MKRTINIGRRLLTFLSVFSILAVSVFSVLVGVDFTPKAATSSGVDIWGGYDSNKLKIQFSGGDGSAISPYIIENGDQLFRMVADAGKSANGEATYYQLSRDIYLNDVSDYKNWGKSGFDMSTLNNWVGSVDHENWCYNGFAGHFDGNGHYINGLYASAYRDASFFPGISNGATVKNVHFRNSYCVNTKESNGSDLEGETDTNKFLKDMKYGSAAVLAAWTYNDSATFTVNNVSICDAYVEATYFTSAMFGALWYGTYATVKNCLVADVTLNSTASSGTAEGAILNQFAGVKSSGLIEDTIVADLKAYGANHDNAWGGNNVPAATEIYTFKNVYSNVDQYFEYNHPDKGTCKFTEDEITKVKNGYLKGTKAKEKLDLDWGYNWQVVDGDYPLPCNQYVIPTGEEYYANGGPKSSEDYWDGTAAKNFAAGTGTADDPYLIETCEQFYAMVTKLNASGYYKIADGVEALYFNDVKGLSYSESLNVFKSNKSKLYAPGESNNFSGYFDGNGVTFYGIKSTGTLRAGLIPQAGNATLKNFTVKNSYFKADDGNGDSSKTEGAAAVVADLGTSVTVTLRNISVTDCYVNSSNYAAGLVACSHVGGCVFIDDCIVSGGEIISDEGSTNHAAFIAGSLGSTHVVKNCISLGVYPAADNTQSYLSSYKNVFTDAEEPSANVKENISGVTKAETSALMGDAVTTTASAFDWVNTWQANADAIPTLRKHVSVVGTPGTAWTGNVADAYAGGDGSKNNPYQIDTAERLAQMLTYCEPSSYYALTADIYINDTTNPDWQSTAKSWFTSSDVNGFTGIFNGNGHTVYGLYNTGVAAGVYAGLIPSLDSAGEARNVKVDKAYISGEAGSYIGAVVGTVADNATNVTVLRAAEVGADVVLTGAANAGGIVGRVGFTKLRMDNSIFKGTISATGSVGGLVGEITGKLEIKQCISIGNAPFVSDANIKAESIYTDADCTLSDVTVLESAKMQGNNASTYMTALDFTDVWAVVDGDYPVPTYVVKSFDGVQGEVWTGEIASNFAGGTGTETDPYLIATGEQLALAISCTNGNGGGGTYYKMICDILLNDVADDLWQAKVGCNTWLHSNDLGYSNFSSDFDGDGYVVYGMYYNYKVTPQNSYLGLFPRIGGSATIKNVGVSQAYIKAALGDESVYAGGLFGMGSAFYDFYGKSIGHTDTVGDEYLVPGDTTPTKLPSFTNCFVDHTCYIEANAAAGIGNPGGAVIVVRDCYVTATLKGVDSTRAGGIIGNQWSKGSRIYNSLSLPQNDVLPSAGTHQWADGESSATYAIENFYYYGNKSIYGATRVKRPQWRVGEAAKTAMPNLDWESTWRVEDEGTPVLRVFDKPGRSASLFSDKSYLIEDSQINFITGTSDVEVPAISGQPYSEVTLPTPTRPGYVFTGWYSFSDITLLYPYDYFLSRDINLYAGWKQVGVIQGFENYTNSDFDCDTSLWNYNKPGSRNGYKVEYAHSGTKSMQLLKDTGGSATLLVNYDEWLTVGQNYQMTFWVATDSADNDDVTLSLIQNNYPDYIGSEVSCEKMVTVTGLQVGEWKQYSYSFNAQTNWVSIKADGNASLYFDDIVIAPVGEIVNDNYIGESGNVNGADDSINSPKTSDTLTVSAVIAAIMSCAVIAVISKKNLVEIIDKD